jgi:putative inorganic carbon (hco3(-)) transporter
MVGDILLPSLARNRRGPRDSGRLPLALLTAAGIIAVILLGVIAIGPPSTRDLAQNGLIGLVAVSVATWFATLGFTNIERFVLITLVARASLDILKPPGVRDSSLAPASLLAIGFIVGAGIWLLSVPPLSKPRPGLVLSRAIIVFAFAAAVSIVGSGSLRITLTDLLRIVAIVMMFFVVERLLEETGAVMRVVHAILLAGVVPIVAGFVGQKIGLPVIEHKIGVTRVVSTFTIANPYAYFLTFLGLTALALAVTLRGSRLRWYYAGYAAVCVAALVTTNVRTAWIAFAVGALVIGTALGWRVVLAFVLIILIVVASIPSVRAQFTDLDTKAYSDNVSENSLTWRIGHWKALLPLTHGHELTGIGLAMTVSSAPDVAKEPHNDYLRAYLEMGVIGIASFLFLIGALISVGFRAYRAARSPTTRAVSLAFLSVSIALAIASLTDNLISNVAVLWYFYALAACATWCLRTSIDAPQPSEQLLTTH